MQPGAAPAAADAGALPRWHEYLSPGVIGVSVFLLLCSAFFSGSEVAFYSLHHLRLTVMKKSPHMLDRLAARLMDHPGSLLTSILMGNSIVNVLLGVVLAWRVEKVFSEIILPPQAAHPFLSYAIAVVITTSVLVFFGEITPKLVVVGRAEFFARLSAFPIYLVDRVLMPVRVGLLLFIGFLFRVTRFSDLRPAPFMTDEEFKSLLSESEAHGVLEEEERQMIQGILEFSDVMIREILVPRPDMIALQENVPIRDALEIFREHEYARIPIYREDLDSITGVLYAKDLLPSVVGGGLEAPISQFARKAHFVPETMSVADFVKTARRLHTHLAIVVDEFGGTEGLVTLQDALREVVGNIGEEDEEEAPRYEWLETGVYLVEGNMPLDELESLTGQELLSDEHTTVAGFLMEQTEKTIGKGDEFDYGALHFIVEALDGLRIARVRVVWNQPGQEESGS
jgi:putative hemolysin